MNTLDQIKFPIKEELQNFNASFPKLMKSNVPLLNILTNYLLKRKGKQMRPMFVFLTAKLVGEINSSTYTAASLIELLHTASLIHDDVVDDAFERRGFLSINALWKSKIAVLLGDFLLAKGLLLAVNKKEYELLEIVSDAVKEMSEGELLQIQNSRKQLIDEETYFNIIRKKTAALIAACTACGVKSVSEDIKTIEKLKRFGELSGIAFQIRDDLLDYEKTNIIGKPAGNDIKEKKITLPLIFALNNSTASERKKILRLLNHSNNNSRRINTIITFVKTKGGIDYSLEKMQYFKNKAIEQIEEYPDIDAKQALIALVDYSTVRKK
ncbi:MAG: polyprenyl synthetase family protein [Bacteroidales bacterium]|nr:polyprenyl synthetase family protein [Bacteroidales bacterium]